MSRQLRGTGDTKDLERLAEQAKTPITAMEQERVSAITTTDSEVSQLKEQITGLTEHVTMQMEGVPRRCFNYNQVCHFQCNCPNWQ